MILGLRMRRLLKWVNGYAEKRIFDSFTMSPESLGLYRIAFAAYALLFRRSKLRLDQRKSSDILASTSELG